MSQLRPIGPIAIDPNGGTDVLPVDVDRSRGTITKVRLFINNFKSGTRDVTVTILGLTPIVVNVTGFGIALVLDDVPVQQTNPSATSQVQIHVDGDDGQGGSQFIAFGSFEVT